MNATAQQLRDKIKEELDVMCARMDALVEVSNLLYDIQWHRLNWERKQNG